MEGSLIDLLTSVVTYALVSGAVDSQINHTSDLDNVA